MSNQMRCWAESSTDLLHGWQTSCTPSPSSLLVCLYKRRAPLVQKRQGCYKLLSLLCWQGPLVGTQLMPEEKKKKRFLFLLFFSCQPRLCHWRRCSCSSVWLSCTSRVLPAHRRQLGWKFFFPPFQPARATLA